MVFSLESRTFTGIGSQTSTVRSAIFNLFREMLDPIYGSPVATFVHPAGRIGEQESLMCTYQLNVCTGTNYGLFMSLGVGNQFFAPRRYLIQLRFSLVLPTATVWNPAPTLVQQATISLNESAETIVDLYALRRTEALIIYYRQQGTFIDPFLSALVPIGFFIPENKPSWWNTDLHPYICTFNIQGNMSLATFNTPLSLTPYSITGNPSIFYTGNILVDTIAGTKDIYAGVPMTGYDGRGLYGNTPDDIGWVSSTGITQGTTIQVGARRWMCLRPDGSRMPVARYQ